MVFSRREASFRLDRASRRSRVCSSVGPADVCNSLSQCWISRSGFDLRPAVLVVGGKRLVSRSMSFRCALTALRSRSISSSSDACSLRRSPVSMMACHCSIALSTLRVSSRPTSRSMSHHSRRRRPTSRWRSRRISRYRVSRLRSAAMRSSSRRNSSSSASRCAVRMTMSARNSSPSSWYDCLSPASVLRSTSSVIVLRTRANCRSVSWSA